MGGASQNSTWRFHWQAEIILAIGRRAHGDWASPWILQLVPKFIDMQSVFFKDSRRDHDAIDIHIWRSRILLHSRPARQKGSDGYP